MAETPLKEHRRIIMSLQKGTIWIQCWVWCGTSLIPITWKPEAVRSLKSKSTRVLSKVLPPKQNKNPDRSINKLLGGCIYQFSKMWQVVLRQGFTEAQALALTQDLFVSTAPRYWNLQPEATTPSALLKVGKVTWFDFLFSLSISLFTLTDLTI